VSLSSVEISVGRARGDRAITADRSETKYLIATDRSASFIRTLHRELVPHRFTGEGANLLPEAQHFSTTIYFDTPSHALLRAARDSLEENVKIRAREYYDLHPSLAELATDPDQIVHYQPCLWFELKRREQDRTFKHRVQLPKAEVPEFLRGLDWKGAVRSGETQDAEAICAFCRSLGEPLEASVLVNYRRQAFQDAAGTLRVTIDLELSYYLPPADLWSRDRALVRGTFGAASALDRICLVEVKQRATTPAWLEKALCEAGGEKAQFSKFLRAGQAVYGTI
jgi:hypothetical protein